MRYTSITYTRRISDGNYGFHEASANADLEGRELNEALSELRTNIDQFINSCFSPTIPKPANWVDRSINQAKPEMVVVPESAPQSAEIRLPDGVEVDTSVTKKRGRPSKTVAPTENKPETVVAEPSVGDAGKTEPVEPEAPATTPVPTEAKKSKVKEVVYDSENLDHKKEMGRILDEVCPMWREPELKPKAVKLSKETMKGKVLFIDGEIDPKFVEEVKQGMK